MPRRYTRNLTPRRQGAKVEGFASLVLDRLSVSGRATRLSRNESSAHDYRCPCVGRKGEAVFKLLFRLGAFASLADEALAKSAWREILRYSERLSVCGHAVLLSS
jgi:hypothetical protein